ncbi:MAG: 5'-methylthioadenosine/adenosylhomocysteine nucleosidase [Erysipelothrix sp.]|nr:5'-methylthioadenosine/adenosylhomocysteine nucleosidase [Erysipelothrix sp.]
MIGIIGAMDEEVTAFLEHVENLKVEERNFQTYYVGTVAQKEVVITKSGVGKSLAAMSASLLISNYPIQEIINIGSAGALHKDFNIGDVIVSHYVALSDFDLEAFGYKKGFEQERYSFLSDETLRSTLSSLNQQNLKVGNMVASDMFVNTIEQTEQILKDYPSALCTDMESGAIAMVCDALKVPFIIIRSISDNIVASTDNKLDFEAFLKIASKNSAHLVQQLITLKK